MHNELFIRPNDLALTSEQASEAIMILQEGYKKENIRELIYNKSNFIPENIIVLYLYYLEQNNYESIVNSYKLQYIDGEALVEAGVTLEERLGLGQIYDYISKYDFTNMPNIFIEGLKIHLMLYSACPYAEFGGKLRTEPVMLNGSPHEVIVAAEARSIFQSYLTKKYEIDDKNILSYIDEVIKDTVYLIKIQPFMDGNKRTFRSLLNLMFGKIGIPPIFIEIEERDLYHDLLFKAIEEDDYEGIIRFYYYKICDAIVNLDLLKNVAPIKEKGSTFIIK